MGNSKILYRTLIASLLVHLALVLLLPGMQAEPVPPAETRVQLSLRQPPERSGMLTETPESARLPETPPDATHLAEHDARAQNPEPVTGMQEQPRAEGDLELFDFRPSDLVQAEVLRNREATPGTPAASPGERAPPTEEPVDSPESPAAAEEIVTASGESAVSRPRERQPEQQPARRPARASSGSARPRPASRRTGVRANGELSLSTYAWTWAPYLRHLRDSIDDRWQPPLAFFMGLVEGDGAIRFRVHPDGSVTSIELVDEIGHPSLARAARNAVDHAGPFRPLPDDFPDPYLDVTWQYRYVILRQ